MLQLFYQIKQVLLFWNFFVTYSLSHLLTQSNELSLLKMTIYILIFIFLLKNHTRELLKIVSVCLPRPFTNFGTSVCVAVGLLEYSHAKKCNFFKTLRFLFFPCVFGIWTIKQKLPEIQFYLLGLVFNVQN